MIMTLKITVLTIFFVKEIIAVKRVMTLLLFLLPTGCKIANY